MRTIVSNGSNKMMSYEETWKTVGLVVFLVLALVLAVVSIPLLIGLLVLTGIAVLTLYGDALSEIDWMPVEFAIMLIPFVCLGLMFVAWAFGLVELGMWATIIGGIVFFFIFALSGNGQTV